jgi:uncharacterized membrane-anchored protein
MKTIRRAALFCIAAAVSVTLAGCGYAFVNVKAELPPDIKKIYIPAFTNLTDEPSIGFTMASALTREMMKSGVLIPVPEADADAELIGTVNAVSYYNRVYDEEDRAVLVTIEVDAGAKLVRKDGRVVWEVADISFTDDYTIGGSSLMLDSGKEAALELAAEKLAADFHDRLLFGY